MVKKLLLLFSCLTIVFILFPSPVSAGDAFLKAGYALQQAEGTDDQGTWLIAGGSDWKLYPFFSLGLDLQYSYKKFTPAGATEEKAHNYFNAYANAKAYFGRNKVIPFVGAGFGLVTATLFFEDLDDTSWEKAFGAQFLGGLIIGNPSDHPSFVAEVQFKVPTGDLSDVKSIHILGGVVF